MDRSRATKHEHKGVTFYVGPQNESPRVGLVWGFEIFMGTRWRESSGCFYDGCEDHPEGAAAWAEASCRAWIDKSRAGKS